MTVESFRLGTANNGMFQVKAKLPTERARSLQYTLMEILIISILVWASFGAAMLLFKLIPREDGEIQTISSLAAAFWFFPLFLVAGLTLAWMARKGDIGPGSVTLGLISGGLFWFTCWRPEQKVEVGQIGLIFFGGTPFERVGMDVGTLWLPWGFRIKIIETKPHYVTKPKGHNDVGVSFTSSDGVQMHGHFNYATRTRRDFESLYGSTLFQEGVADELADMAFTEALTAIGPRFDSDSLRRNKDGCWKKITDEWIERASKLVGVACRVIDTKTFPTAVTYFDFCSEEMKRASQSAYLQELKNKAVLETGKGIDQVARAIIASGLETDPAKAHLAAQIQYGIVKSKETRITFG